MLRYLFHFRRSLATTFLVVFVNVLVGQCWCATLNQPLRGGLAAVPAGGHCAEAAPPSKPAHPGCHGHGVAKTKQPDAEKNHHPAKPGKSGHDCCKDKSASLLASLDKPAEKSAFHLAPALLPAAADVNFLTLAGRKWDCTAAVRLVPPRHLPPKIPDIRIFLRSLTV